MVLKRPIKTTLSWGLFEHGLCTLVCQVLFLPRLHSQASGSRCTPNPNLHIHAQGPGFWDHTGSVPWWPVFDRLLEADSDSDSWSDSHEQIIEIYVETLSGKIITLQFDQFDLHRRRLTLDLIKKRIKKLEAIPYSQLLLMLNDKVLDNGELLDDYYNLDRSNLHLVLMRDYGSSYNDIHWWEGACVRQKLASKTKIYAPGFKVPSPPPMVWSVGKYTEVAGNP